MNPNFLDFEQPIAELDAKIQELRAASHGQAFNIEDEVARLKDKLKHKTADIFRNLTAWQIAQLARHPARPSMRARPPTIAASSANVRSPASS